MTTDKTSPDHVTVFFDGQCPLCAREIGFYQRQKGAEGVKWVDVTTAPQEALPTGLTQKDALARFHVLSAGGELVSGGQAFTTLWLSLPAFRWGGRLLQARFLAGLLEMAYRVFLPCRPLLQRCLTRISALSPKH